MSTTARTTISLDKDVLERVRHESRLRGKSFKETLNDLLRTALAQAAQPQVREFSIRTSHMGYRPGLDYDDIESLIVHGESEEHR